MPELSAKTPAAFPRHEQVVMSETFLDGKIVLWPGDCLDVLKGFDANSFDACVTDQPYGFSTQPDIAEVLRHWLAGDDYKHRGSGFMGKSWDSFVPGPSVWKQIFRVLKPGGHLLAFCGPRTADLAGISIRLGGFEIRDQVQWLFGSGFPKSLDVSKAIDKAAGAEREIIGPGHRHNSKRCAVAHGDTERLAGGVPGITAPATDDAMLWQGFGTALKPACEPIVMARKPLSESTVAANVLKWGTGALNIDGCRVAGEVRSVPQPDFTKVHGRATKLDAFARNGEMSSAPLGRWPANVIHDGSEEVVRGFPGDAGGHDPRGQGSGTRPGGFGDVGANCGDSRPNGFLYGDSGSAARFFYTAKADADDRLGSKHPTVKPLDLMQYLVRLVTPPGGLILDPFAGTGTTGEAAWREGMRAILIQRGSSKDELEYLDDIRRRMALCLAGPAERRRESAKMKPDKPFDAGSLFAQ
jgi:site-specific DNA-methyltransferase (adenine-specific)